MGIREAFAASTANPGHCADLRERVLDPNQQKRLCEKTKNLVGQITMTYDPVPLPSTIPYPHGYLHDLSLVTGDRLPNLSSPLNAPAIAGWGGVQEVLNGEPCFAAGQLVVSGKANIMAGAGLTDSGKVAVVECLQYIWRERAVSTAVLWRMETDWDSTEGVSGSVLFQGTPQDENVTAVCFQTFGLTVTAAQLLRDQRGGPRDDMPWYFLNAGFMLLDEILQSSILLDINPGRRSVSHPEQKSEDIVYCGIRSFSGA
ncbi:hypothetical protein B0T26DRAFT_397520 [Lasiosphaeria miniovina]|uniref:Uncharacterized protein n=1 Tax=Lasiosphaeria miniovina TaxID=1954250 RepID=A0AA40A4J3_9PEZI|nr:uncharacterized protein B0T26DRAFT_397520 [Lasiosphaeria miniovina]KAK0709181.1 hypothetical protein B0T26DRAFT_397520 [Lasiosphaeria miniovina]